MVTRRDLLIVGAAAAWLPACRADDAGGTAPARPDHGHGAFGTRIADWTEPHKAAGSGAGMAARIPDQPGAPGRALRMARGAPPSSFEQAVLDDAAAHPPHGTRPGFTAGIWARNPGSRTLNFTFALINGKGDHEVRWHCAVDPSADWVFLTMSPGQQLAMGWQFGSDAPARVRVTQQDNMEEGPWQAGDSLLFGPVYVDVGSRPLFLLTFDDGFASQVRASAPDAPSGRRILERYGFKGNLFIVPSWLGTNGVHGYGATPNRFMSADDMLAAHAAGWSIGSHSNTHPSSRDNAGLRLLGPYGYFLSNPVDKLPPLYVRSWGLNEKHRRRVTGASAGSAVLRFENPHQLLVNMPLVFTHPAPPGFAPGTVYYCQSTPGATTATFATDQGSLRDTVKAGTDWTGLADYRYAGAGNDDSAIHNDLVEGVNALRKLGIRTASTFFALPQGSADSYVRSACVRAGLQWVRGASLHGHTFIAGRPTGGGLQNIVNQPGGWLAQPDCVQTDGTTPSAADIRAYVDDTITQGACGCSYHHDVAGDTVRNLDGLCAYLKNKVEAREIDVVTLDQLAGIRRDRPPGRRDRD
jgi:hypothetical protein